MTKTMAKANSGKHAEARYSIDVEVYFNWSLTPALKALV
jgi:hypothetical protein